MMRSLNPATQPQSQSHLGLSKWFYKLVIYGCVFIAGMSLLLYADNSYSAGRDDRSLPIDSRLRGVTTHHIDDPELLLRAESMSPVTVPPPKIAFLLLTKGSLPLTRFWEQFFPGYDGIFSIYVHTHPSSPGDESEPPVFFGRRIPSKVGKLLIILCDVNV